MISLATHGEGAVGEPTPADPPLRDENNAVLRSAALRHIRRFLRAAVFPHVSASVGRFNEIRYPSGGDPIIKVIPEIYIRATVGQYSTASMDMSFTLQITSEGQMKEDLQALAEWLKTMPWGLP